MQAVKQAVGFNTIDFAIAKLAMENEFHQIIDPVGKIAGYLDGVSFEAIRNRIKIRKHSKLLTTKSNARGTQYTRIDVTQKFIDQVCGNLTLPTTNGNQPHVVTEPQKPVLRILVDLENITYAELTRPERVSFSKLREYARKYGRVFQPEIYVPYHYLNPEKENEVNYFNLYEWKVVLCGRLKKDKDQVDNRLSREVHAIASHCPDHLIWIISRDTDFLALVEQYKDNGNHNIEMKNPFDIPEILGYEKREMETALSRPVLNMLETIKSLTPDIKESETNEQRLLRYSAGWFLSHGSNVIEFNNHNACAFELNNFLRSRLNNRLKTFPEFPKHVIKAYREVGLICEMDGNKRSYRLLINRDHELFQNMAPQHFLESAIVR